MEILYLPSLKNVVADFFVPPTPHQSHLELSLPQWWRIQLISKPWPQSKIATQKRSVCSAVHPSNLLSNKQALNARLAIFTLEFVVPLSH
jgi:hypothetical protein